MGCIATLFTIREVMITSEATRLAHRDSPRITKKILMTNMGSMLTMVVYLVHLIIIIRDSSGSQGKYEKEEFLLVVWTVMVTRNLSPSLASAVNPIIFITMTPNFFDGVTLRRVRSVNRTTVKRKAVNLSSKNKVESQRTINPRNTATSLL
jgi:hypothetical protein